jgi:hypothetical protein
MTEAGTNVEFSGLLSIVASNGLIIEDITLDELDAINTIREIVNETTEGTVVSYTGS